MDDKYEELREDFITLDKALTHITTILTQLDKKVSTYEIYKDNKCIPKTLHLEKRLDELDFKISNMSSTLVSINTINQNVNDLLWVNKLKQWFLSGGIMAAISIISGFFYFYNMIITSQKTIHELEKQVTELSTVIKKHEYEINAQLRSLLKSPQK